jgi:hypothetical protein
MHILTGRIAFAGVIVAVLVAITYGLSSRTPTQQLQPAASPVADPVTQQVEKSVDHALRVIENDDAPLRILEARVKEIPGHDFQKLTGKKTDLTTICSVPEVRLLNSSGKTITEFFLAVRDPKSKSTRGTLRTQLSIDAGETYTVSRDSFVRREWVSTIDKEGEVKAQLQSPLKSERFWISFAERADLFITVVQVGFRDGSAWKVKEGGDIR